MKKGIAPIILLLVIFVVGGVSLLTIKSFSPKEKNQPTVKPTLAVPLPSEKSIITTFFNLIDEKRVDAAVSMMTNSILKDDSQKQAWGVQFNAFNSVKVLKIESSMPEEWSGNEHSYRVTLEVKMDPGSANAPIPYYGWENGQNIRWITLEKSVSLWKIKGIATGP